MSQYEEEEERIKVILVGSSGVGKTSLINSLIGKSFKEDESSTISANYQMKNYNINKNYDLAVWDTAGQEKYRSMTKLFFKNAKICILVYDVTNKQTFDDLNNWLYLLKDIEKDDVILGVVGNKADLFIREEVREEEAKDYANSIKAKFSLVSAKENSISFDNFVKELLEEYISKNIRKNNPEEKKITINIQKNDMNKKKKKKFC